MMRTAPRSAWIALITATALLVAPASALAKRQLLETLRIAPGESKTTETAFEREGEHIAVISGTMSERTFTDIRNSAGEKTGEAVDGADYDPLYSFTCVTNSQSCPSFRPYYFPDLMVTGPGGYSDLGGGLNNYTEVGKAPPYSASHSYTLPVDYATGRLTFTADNTALPPEGGRRKTHTGAYTVKIYGDCDDDCGPALPVTVDWEMQERYGKRRSDGIIDPLTSSPEVNPDKGFEVDIELTRKGARCTGKEKYVVTIDGRRESLSSDERKRCKFTVRMKEGDRKFKVTGKAKGRTLEGNETIRVQDWLIVGLGDSIGSGEGNPDLPAGGGRNVAKWQDRRCHRSGYSYQARAAERLEARDKQTSVTFVHLACSGAAILEGVTGEYGGIVTSTAQAKLTAQIAAAKDLFEDREVDAAIVSIGANDLRFGGILEFCVKWATCQDETYDEGMTLNDWTASRFTRGLPDYASLASALNSAGVFKERVYLVQYPDTLRDEDGTAFCDSIISLGGLLKMRANEAQWAFENFLLPLNGVIQSTSERFGWQVVRGAQQGFAPHGYCAEGGARWMVQLLESRRNQGDTNGAMHPNRRGHLELMQYVRDELFTDLYPRRQPRPPRDAR